MDIVFKKRLLLKPSYAKGSFMFWLFISIFSVVSVGLHGADWKAAKKQLIRPYIEYSDYDIEGKYGLASADKMHMDLALKDAQKQAEEAFYSIKRSRGGVDRLWKIDKQEKAIQKAREELASGVDPKNVSRHLSQQWQAIRNLSKINLIGLPAYRYDNIGLGSLLGVLPVQTLPLYQKSVLSPMQQKFYKHFGIPGAMVGPMAVQGAAVHFLSVDLPHMSKYAPKEAMRRAWYAPQIKHSKSE